MKKQMPPFYFFSFIVLEIILSLLLPIYKLSITPYNYLGLVIVIFGLWLNLSSKRTVLNNKTTIIPFQKSTVLVINGAFCYTRNPMYLGMLLVLVGEAIVLRSASTFLFPILFIPLMSIKYIIPEEKILENTFKDKYLEYKQKVRRWI